MAQDLATFVRLAELRLEEAKVLLANGQPSGAYYLAGYAVECALKAKIAGGFRENEIPDLKRVRSIYTHDLSGLLELAGLKKALDEERDHNSRLYARWMVIKTWSESARYSVWTELDASAMLAALEGDDGLLRWLQKH